jgi:hypothetical protein
MGGVRSLVGRQGRLVRQNEAALKALILEAVGLNKSKANEPSFDESHHL